MKISIINRIKASFQKANQWFYNTPERALDQAYQAVLTIKSIEDERFGGKKISAESTDYGDSAMSYFESELNKHLNIARVRLTEFKTSRSILNISEQKPSKGENNSLERPNHFDSLDFHEQPSIIIEKLNFIDGIIEKYSLKGEITSLMVMPEKSLFKIEDDLMEPENANQQNNSSTKNTIPKAKNLSDKTGVLPRSILGTLNRLQRELDPKAEDEVVRNFRRSKNKTVISIRFLLLLILLPLLTQQITKTLVVGPIIDKIRAEPKTEIFLNVNLKEEAFIELERFQRELEFKTLIGFAPELSTEEKEEKIKEKAFEIAEEYRGKSGNALKNVGADLFSFLSFCWVLAISRREIEVLKSFIDDIVYGLSDSAKAFIIILFTDIFVGFHSPHGWEVLLEGISRHLGLPENHQFMFLFIATFPVILDTMIKYWIFRYLNRLSPSAVATYKNMNE